MSIEFPTTDKMSALEAVTTRFVEKTWEYRWGIQLTYAALYIDTLLAISLQTNLLSITTSTSQVWESIGGLLVAVAGFCILVSIVIPVIAQFLNACFITYMPNWLSGIISARDPHMGEVSLHTLHTEALSARDDFLMKIYRESRSEWRRKLIRREHIATLVVGLGLLVIANIWAGNASGVQTLIRGIFPYDETVGYVGLSGVFFVALTWAWTISIPASYLYHPHLSRQLKLNQNRRQQYNLE